MISLEKKIKTLVDKGEEITISKTDFGTRKNQYKITLKNGEEFVSKVLHRLITKIFKLKTK